MNNVTTLVNKHLSYLILSYIKSENHHDLLIMQLNCSLGLRPGEAIKLQNASISVILYDLTFPQGTSTSELPVQPIGSFP